MYIGGCFRTLWSTELLAKIPFAAVLTLKNNCVLGIYVHNSKVENFSLWRSTEKCRYWFMVSNSFLEPKCIISQQLCLSFDVRKSLMHIQRAVIWFQSYSSSFDVRGINQTGTRAYSWWDGKHCRFSRYLHGSMASLNISLFTVSCFSFKPNAIGYTRHKLHISLLAYVFILITTISAWGVICFPSFILLFI